MTHRAVMVLSILAAILSIIAIFVFLCSCANTPLSDAEPDKACVEHSKATLDACVIVEPRNHAALHAVIANIASQVSCNIKLFHGILNIALVTDIAQKYPGRVILYNLGVENLSIQDYNKLLYDINFWRLVGESDDKVLMFQTDSGICIESDPGVLAKALEHDYCGAPWNASCMGNGGFSIRRVGAMIDALTTHTTDNGNEDTFFARTVTNKCSMDTAYSFSQEQVASNITPFGFHAPWKYGHCPCSQSSLIQTLQYVMK
jgi:hypothetical protein